MAMNIDIALVVGFFGGIVSFFGGFRAYRTSRLLQDRPCTPIRSIAMGFVRIHGKAQSDQLVNSPVTHTPCCYYIVQIHKWEQLKDSQAYSSDEERGPRGGWMPHGADADGAWFYLEDATGHVLVDPYGAQHELDMTGTREVDSMTASSLATSGVLLGHTKLESTVRYLGIEVEHAWSWRSKPRCNDCAELSRIHRKWRDMILLMSTPSGSSAQIADVRLSRAGRVTLNRGARLCPL